MRTYLLALNAELLKIRKSKVVWITAAAFTIVPLLAGFFMFVLKNPEFSKSSGLLGAKAQIAGEASWPAYLSLHAQMIAVGGILIFGFITSWLFGREYSDGTAKDLLALPYSRAVIVLAKFAAAFITNVLMSVYVILIGLAVGWIINLPQWSTAVLIDGLFKLLVVTLLIIILSFPASFFASYGRGYLAPLGFVILSLVLSQIVAAAGYGEFFPWAIPALYSGLAEGGAEGGAALNSSNITIIMMTSLTGIIGTLYWWIFADQH